MNSEICQQLIELILNIRVKEIKYPEREKVIERRADSKGIRLDVYVEGNKYRFTDGQMFVDGRKLR